MTESMATAFETVRRNGLAALLVAVVLVTPGASQEADSTSTADAPKISVLLSSPEIQVGDLVEARILVEVNGSGYSEPAFPNWQRHWGTAEIREIGDVERVTAGGVVRFAQTVTVTAFRPGTVELPPAEISWPGRDPVLRVSSRPVAFTVVSVLPEDPDSLEPKPAAAPRSLAVGSRFWWTAAALAALALALGAVLWSRSKTADADVEFDVDPWLAFEEALDRLSVGEDAQEVFTGMSIELRRFLGRSLAFPAAESTTTELRRRLRKRNLPLDVSSALVKLLVEADSVKFARESPSRQRTRDCLEDVRSAALGVRRLVEEEERVKSAMAEEAPRETAA